MVKEEKGFGDKSKKNVESSTWKQVFGGIIG